MNRIFKPCGYFAVRDGTDVAPFLNATDVKQHDVPWGALGEMSIASGRIGPKVHSWVHVHPVVTQVTYVLVGKLTVRMMDPAAAEPYDLPLVENEAVVSPPGTLFQLRNDNDAAAEVLYIVSPSYVFELEGSEVRHDDTILVAKTWEELANSNYDVPAAKASRYEASARREESLRRMAQQKGISRQPLIAENVYTLKSQYDHLAPDGSEIRLLVQGDRGGFAHCVLPAGKTSAPMRHRTVEELWYVLEGVGKIWRGREGEPSRIHDICAGDSVRIPVDTAFQFQAAIGGDLKLLLATMPPWPPNRDPTAKEAVETDGRFTMAAESRDSV